MEDNGQDDMEGNSIGYEGCVNDYNDGKRRRRDGCLCSITMTLTMVDDLTMSEWEEGWWMERSMGTPATYVLDTIDQRSLTLLLAYSDEELSWASSCMDIAGLRHSSDPNTAQLDRG